MEAEQMVWLPSKVQGGFAAGLAAAPGHRLDWIRLMGGGPERGRLLRQVLSAMARSVLLAVVIAVSAHAADASPERNDEPAAAKVIAGYLAGFARNLVWPDSAAGEPIHIGLVAEPAIVAQMRPELNRVTVNGRRLVAVAAGAPTEADRHEIVLLYNPSQRQVDEFTGAAAGKPVLTVVYSEDRSARGGIIELVAVKSSLRYTLNARELRRAGLQASPELLEFALRTNPR